MSFKARKYLVAASAAGLFGTMLIGQGVALAQPAIERQPGDDSVLMIDSEQADVVYDDGATLVIDTSKTTEEKGSGAFLDDIISGKNKDSLVYDLKAKKIYIYKEGEVEYQDKTLKADIMEIDMTTKEIFAHGITDTLGQKTRPEFIDNDNTYTMDTIRYNLDTGKAKIQGVATQEGEGYLIGNTIKKMPDNSIHIHDGKYTTCDRLDCPHFYLQMTKAKMIPGQKVVIGPSYLVMEDVPIYFLGVPFGFFPINPNRHSGFIMPSYGEEGTKGFFIRDGGYYFAFNDYMDLTLTGSIYTLGSWDLASSSRYIKRYSYSGNFSANFSKILVEDEINSNSFRLQWTHSQDPRFRPNSTFSASVNFTTAGYNKYAATNINDIVNSQTNSTVSYSKNWANKPFSLAASLSASQRSSDSTIMLTLPNMSFNVSKFFPLQRREAVGKQRWYEKISMSYAGTFNASVTEKEYDILTSKTLEDLSMGANHNVPISTSATVLKYITLSPSANYQERWYFRQIEKEWSPAENRVINADTTYGFYRLFNYSTSVAASTKVYGTYQFGPTSKLQAVRHVMSPSISASYTPNFGAGKYGYWRPIQTDANGTIRLYSPFEGSMYGVPGSAASASLSFSLGNTLEAKVLSQADTTGVKKLKIIDNLSASGSWDFLRDSLNLSTIPLSLRTANLIGNFGIQLNATLDPYQIDEQGEKINRFMMEKGKLGRITQASWSFGYTFQSTRSGQPAVNDINSAGAIPPDQTAFFTDPSDRLDPETKRRLMTQQYYDFDIPWNFGFNYSLSYSKPRHTATITQTMSFQGSVNLTSKWGVSFSGGYDFSSRRMTIGQFTLSRDLHCWQMTFSTIPFGFHQSWNFNIGVRSALLQDLKYEQSSSFFDNLLY